MVQSFPGCGGNFVLNNDEWFAFFAGTTSITIEVTPSNCSQGANMGLQGGIYQGCGGPTMDVQCQCTTQPFILTSNNYIIGQIYWFVLDGCSGNVCDYSIDVVSGSTVGVPPNDPGPVTGPLVVCPSTTGAYSLPPVVGATTYVWTLTPASAGTVTGTGANVNVNWAANASGTAQLCVTTSNQCYSNPMPSCITVEIKPRPTATLSGSGILCPGSTTPINLNVSFTGEPVWQFTYAINGVPQTPIQTSTNPYTLMATQPGTYTLVNVSTVGANCLGTVSGTSTVTNSTLNGTATTTASTCEQTNGSINLTPTGGTTPYTYSWSNGATVQDPTSVTGGTYTVTITDNAGCTRTVLATVNNTNITFSVSGAVTANTTCIMPGNGAINVTVAPPGTYTYTWSNAATTEDLTNLAPGTYNLTVSAGGICTQTASFTINDNPDLPNPTLTPINSTCDLSNGSVNLSVSGGVAPFTYLWSNGATTMNIPGLLAGPYSVTITGANNCTNTATTNVNNNNPPININGNITINTTCLSPGNGSINVTVSPNGTYTYNWSTGATTEDIVNLVTGTYTITVSSVGSCSATAEFTVDENPNEPNINSTVVNTTCDLTNGSINVSISGGITPYVYMWSNGATTEDLPMLLAGAYTLTVTGANGCTNTAEITVSNNNPTINVTANITANTTCNANGNGAINASVSPAGNYTYIWSNGATTQDLVNLLPGTYTVTVNGGGSCTTTQEFTVNDNPNEPNINGMITPTTCNLSNGAITVTATGGVPPYTFLWSNGATTNTINGIPQGDYTITVTASNGCTNTAEFTVSNDNPLFNITAVIIANTLCSSVGNGSINVTITPPGSYSYLWSNGATTQDLSALLPGDYTISVTTQGTCTEDVTFTVGDNPNDPNLFLSTIQANCGLSNGSINLTVSGGVTPYTYLWSNGATTQDLNAIPADVYQVTVTGANGCSNTDGEVINDNEIPIFINAVVTDVTSCLTNNGRIILTVQPSNATITWSIGSSATILNNLAPGDYSVTVSAGGTCTETETFTITDATEAPGIISDVTAAICGAANGMIDLTIAAGIAPYTYKWSNSKVTQDLNNLAAGTYSVTVTSATGCTAEAEFEVPNNNVNIDIFGYLQNNISCAAPNGNIILDISPTGTYTYKWSTGSMAANISNLVAGSYTVTVSTGLTCSSSATFIIENDALPPTLSLAGSPSTCNLSNGGVNLTVSGGSAPYIYTWSNGITTQDLINITTGTYSVTVRDNNFCTTVASELVTNNNVVLDLNTIITENTSCISNNGALNLTVVPAGNYVYKWSTNATTEDISALMAGLFTVTVTAGVSCSAVATYQIDNNTPFPIISPNITPAICSVNNGAIDLSISGTAAPYFYNWSNSVTTEDQNSIFPGNYSVTVTAANGCTADTTLNVANNSSTFSLSGTASPYSNCAQINGAVDLTITPAGPYTILWSNAATTQDISNLPAGTYTVSVTESGSCTASATYIIDDTRSYPNSNVSLSAEICGLINGAIDLDVNGGLMPYAYKWQNNATTEDLLNIVASTYTVTITGANNCTVTASAVVPPNSVSFSLASTLVPNSSCVQNNGSIDIVISPPVPGLGLNYTYQWSNAQTTQDLNGLLAGNYTLTVSAGGTCINTGSYNVLDNANSPQVIANTAPALCGQASGAINLNVTGSVQPYAYFWSNGETTEEITDLIEGGYAVTVTSASGCITIDNFTVIDNVLIPSITGTTVANTSCINNNGGTSIDVTPMVLSYTYAWSSGETTANLSDLAAGTYTVTVYGGGACTASNTFEVDENAAVLNANGTHVNILCFEGNEGSIDLTINNATLPIIYNWSPAIPGNPEDPTNLVANAYNVTATDANGCTTTTDFTITQPADAVAVTCSPINDVSAPGAIDGSGKAEITGGTAPYSVAISPGTTQQNVLPGILQIDNLGQGGYAVNITDANGCTAVCNFVVPLVTCTSAVGTMSGTLTSLCGLGCITANYNSAGQVLDTNDALQFILHNGTGAQIENEIARSSTPSFCFIQNLMAFGTTYYVSAVVGDSDGNGNVSINDYCTVISIGSPIVFREKPVASIEMPDPINCAVLEVVLTGASNLVGGTYDWNTLNGQLVGITTQQSTMALKSGDYTLIIDVEGCKDTATTQVLDIRNAPEAVISASPDDILDCTIDEIILTGAAEGTLSANTVWISNGTVYVNGTILMIDNPGQYMFIVVDTVTLCRDSTTITIDEDQAYPPLFTDPPSVITCTNKTAVLSGGSFFPGITFKWVRIVGNDTILVGNGASVTVALAGTYHLIGIDPANGCTNGQSIVVTANLAVPNAEAGIGFSIECFGETATLDGSASSGNSALSYMWNTNNGVIVSGADSAAPTINEPGTYTLTVTQESNGCSDTDPVVVNPKEPYLSLSVDQPPCLGDKGTISVDSVRGAKPPIQFSLNNNSGFSTQDVFSSLSPSTYTVYLKDANGCTTSASKEIIAALPFEVTLATQAIVLLGDSFQIATTVTGSLLDIQNVTWTPSIYLSCDTCLNPIATPYESTRYQVSVINDQGCEDRESISLFVDKSVDVYIPNIFSPNGDGLNDIFLIFANMRSIKQVNSFQIFSRWGEQVFLMENFEPNSPTFGWDGSYKGSPLNPAVFVWYAAIEFIDGRKILFEGDVTIER